MDDTSAPSRGPKWPLWAIAVFSLLIALASARYLVPGAPGGAPPILANAFARYGVLTVHAGFSLTALALGPFQFFKGLRERRRSLHRRMGTVYVIACLGGGLAGLILAFGATTGPISTAGFGLLAIVWVFTTSRAWLAARARRLAEHERWMIRSFALTLAAVTLRLYLPVVMIGQLPYDPAYRAISFLCWVPNLIVAELLIRRWFRTSPSAGASGHRRG